MRTVEDDSGRRYLLLKRSAESSLVHEIETGEERYVSNDRLVDRDGIDPVTAAASAVPGDVRRQLPSVHDERALGLLVLLSRESRSVRSLLDETDLCESDILAHTSELRAAGMITETTVDGERGYTMTEEARATFRAPQSATTSISDPKD